MCAAIVHSLRLPQNFGLRKYLHYAFFNDLEKSKMAADANTAMKTLKYILALYKTLTALLKPVGIYFISQSVSVTEYGKFAFFIHGSNYLVD